MSRLSCSAPQHRLGPKLPGGQKLHVPGAGNFSQKDNATHQEVTTVLYSKIILRVLYVILQPQVTSMHAYQVLSHLQLKITESSLQLLQWQGRCLLVVLGVVGGKVCGDEKLQNLERSKLEPVGEVRKRNTVSIIENVLIMYNKQEI